MPEKISISMLLLFATAGQTNGQQVKAHKPINLVMPTGTGRIIIPSGDDLQWQTVNLYDQGTRPVFQITSKTSKIDISYALFPNKTGSASPGDLSQ